MTDRQLLEDAAKAFWGKEIDDVCLIRWSENDNSIVYMHGENQDHNGCDVELCWNPLDDDGDVLRLEVTLKATAAWEPMRGGWSIGAVINDEFKWLAFHTSRNRATTMAAAEIGRAMP